jgi:hypothetical protein
MTPFHARLILSAVMAIFLITAVNALFLQERASLRPGMGPSSAASVVMQFSPGQAPKAAGSGAEPRENGSSPAQTRQIFQPPRMPQDPAARLATALERELLRKGYKIGPGKASLNAALLVYEYDSRLPLTGAPTEALLKHLIFDLNPAPRGLFADRAEADPRLVLATQKLLLELGFFSGMLSGHVDVWTSNAIKTFERYKGLPVTGRLNELTLLELVSYSGLPLKWADTGQAASEAGNRQ